MNIYLYVYIQIFIGIYTHTMHKLVVPEKVDVI